MRATLAIPLPTGCLSRGSTRRPTRAQPLHGANRHGGNHLQRHGSRPSHQPFDEIECQIGPKIPHDPASLVAGAPPGSAGQKRKWKSPVRRRRGPRKNPCTRLSAHAKYPWFTRSRWTEECKAAPSWVAVRLKTRMTKLRKRRRAARGGAVSANGQTRAYTTKPDGLSVRYFTIGRTSEVLSWPGSYGGEDANSALRLRLISTLQFIA